MRIQQDQQHEQTYRAVADYICNCSSVLVEIVELDLYKTESYERLASLIQAEFLDAHIASNVDTLQRKIGLDYQVSFLPRAVQKHKK
ncbi:MAG: hypothetical protein EZS28_052851 [Streblomastix strix]|uniref:Uncharacterized protein n=1 Tax=Streblomastix strix TaxID=222440 RepID=A0A5J4RUQ9_9EUKA|nr:MAG: hypothetical protein EZS28_052851 [Streblomastix strix]